MNAKIGLKDVRFHGPHGYYEEENVMGNEFSIDVQVESSITGAAAEDDLGGTVNYSTIYYLLQAEMKKPTKLLEALAYRMAKRIMDQFDNVTSVNLKLKKLNPPLGGKVGAAIVEISLGGGMPGPSMGAAVATPSGGATFGDDAFGGGDAFGGSDAFGGGDTFDDDGDFDYEDDEYYD